MVKIKCICSTGARNSSQSFSARISARLRWQLAQKFLVWKEKVARPASAARARSRSRSLATAEAAWADVTGDLDTLVAFSLPATRADAGRVYLTLRDSLCARVAAMFADSRCDNGTRELVREFVTGWRSDGPWRRVQRRG